MTKYSDIQSFNLAEKWKGKKWITLSSDFRNIEDKEGIYRIQLKAKLSNMEYIHCVGKNKLIADVLPNTYLSVGKSSHLRTRLLSQHFSPNHSANRLGRHLATLFPNYKSPRNDSNGEKFINKKAIKKLIDEKKISIEFFYEKKWWKRDLFETYGKALYKCLFDLGIEH